LELYMNKINTIIMTFMSIVFSTASIATDTDLPLINATMTSATQVPPPITRDY
jgi:hypothetical protein